MQATMALIDFITNQELKFVTITQTLKKIKSNPKPEERSQLQIIWDGFLYALRVIIHSFLP